MANVYISDVRGRLALVKPKEGPSSTNAKVRKDYLDITGLIRSIQRAEGNPDCFGKARGYCDRTDCAWREYCL